MLKKLVLVLASLIATNSFAQTIPNELLTSPNSPVVTVGGYTNFTAAGRFQDKAYSQTRLPDSALNSPGSSSKASNNGVDIQFPGTYNRYSNKYGFVNDSEVYVKAGAVNEYGMKYGGVIELEANLSQDATNRGLNASKTFIFTESQIGRFEFGNNLGANQKMKVGPSTFARAAGGINGKYLEHINFPMYADSTRVADENNVYCLNSYSTLSGAPSNSGAGGNTPLDTRLPSPACIDSNLKAPSFILIPQSPIAHGGYAKGFYDVNGSEDPNLNSNYESINGNRTGSNFLQVRDGSFGQQESSTKLSYYAPRIEGFQLGLSFTPDTGDNGTSRIISGKDTGDVNNVVSGGLNYSKSFGNLGFAASATFEQGKFEQPQVYEPGGVTRNNVPKRNKLMAYDVGLMATYFGFTLGGSYGGWGKSLQPLSGPNSCQYDSSLPLLVQNCEADTKRFGKAGYYTLGGAYEIGPFAASLTYLSSSFQNNKYQAASLGFDYRLAKGLMPYLEVTRFNFESYQPQYLDINTLKSVDQSSVKNNQRQLQDNSGYVVLAGMLLVF